MTSLEFSLETFYFQAHWMALGFLILPLLAFWIAKNRKQQIAAAIRFSPAASLDVLKAQPKGFKVLLSPLLGGLLLFFLILSIMRPTATVVVPTQTVDLMLVMDISISMLAEDLKPDRMTAAKTAAEDFVQSLPNDTHLGLIFFAGDAFLAEPMSRDRQRVIDKLRALRREDLRINTSIGTAIQAAIGSFEDISSSIHQPSPSDNPINPLETVPQNSPNPTPPGIKPPDRVIVLLSDGDSFGGYPLPLAVQNASASNITLYTVGIGSHEPVNITYQGQQYPVYFNENTLKSIAQQTGGQYFRVLKSSDFKTVYDTVRQKTLRMERQTHEFTWLTSALALLSALGFILLHQTLLRRFP